MRTIVAMVAAGVVAMGILCAGVWGQVKDEELGKLAAEADRIVVAKVAEFEMMRSRYYLTVEKTLKGSVAGGSSMRSEGGAGDQLPAVEGPGMRRAKDERRWIVFLREKRDEEGRRELYRLRPTGWFVEDSPEMEKRVIEAIPVPTEWGEEVNGLKMGLRLRNGEVKLGEGPAIEVSMRNMGKQAVMAMEPDFGTRAIYGRTELELEGKKRWRAQQPGGDIKDIYLPPARLLEPGESFTVTAHVEDWRAMGMVKPWEESTTTAVMGEAGEYRVRVKYSAQGWPKGTDVWGARGENRQWTGELISNTATAKVVTEGAQWGEPVNGAQVGLKVKEGEKGGEGPRLAARVRNAGEDVIGAVVEDKRWMEVEVDGKWYHHLLRGSPGRTWSLARPRGEIEARELALDRRARLTSIEGEQPLRLGAGKHRIRVRIPVMVTEYKPEERTQLPVAITAMFGAQWDPLTRAVSNAVEIEVPVEKAYDAAREKREEQERTAAILGTDPAGEREAAAKRAVKAGDEAFQKQDYEEALRVYRLVTEAEWARGLEEKNYCRYMAGRCEAEVEEEEVAFATYKGLIEEAPYSDWAGEAMLRAEGMYFARREYDAAIEAFERLLEENPKGRMRPYLMEKMAFNYIMKKDYEEAERILNQVIKEYAGVDAGPKWPEGLHVAYAKDYLQVIKDKKRADAEEPGREGEK